MPVPRPRSIPSLAGLRLPKGIESDASGPALHAALQAHADKLWQGGSALVPTAGWSPALATALESAEREGHLVRGLEQVEKALAREARGLAMADARSGAERGARVSRLVLVSHDGTERFYRQVERLSIAQAPRVLIVRLAAGSAQLSSVVPGAAGVVRALMVEHKESVVRVLWALYAIRAEG